MNDPIHVVSTVSEVVYLPDISMDVPPNLVISIPGHEASLSTDLWRALGQKRLVRVPNGSTPPDMPAAKPNQDEYVKSLEDRIKTLEQGQAVKPVPDIGTKLDQILQAIQTGSITHVNRSPVKSPEPEPEVDGSVPTFIPSTIKVEGQVQQVEVPAETSQDSALKRSRQALRELRQKQ